MYSSTLPIMRQRAVTLSIYTITDNTVTLHQSERHQDTHSERHTQSTGTKFRGINSLHHVINPTLPPTVRKGIKICKKGKLKCGALNTVLTASPSLLLSSLFCYLFSLFSFTSFSPPFTLFYFSIFCSSIYPLLQPQPVCLDERRLLVTLGSVCTQTHTYTHLHTQEKGHPGRVTLHKVSFP